MERIDHAIRISAVALVLLSAPFLLRAQDQPGQGYVEVGARAMSGDWASSQFNQYTDTQPGFFIMKSGFTLNDIGGKKASIICETRDTLRRNSSYRCDVEHYGRYRLEFRWDDTPHEFTNTAATPYTILSPGNYALSYTTVSSIQATPSLLANVLSTSNPIDMTLMRRKAGVTLTITPGSNWLILLQFTHENEKGYRPIGTVQNQIVELPEPIDYNIIEGRAIIEYATKRLGFESGFGSSSFTDNVKAMTWSAPAMAADTNGASSRNQMPMYPDNTAQNAEFAGAVNLGHATRFMASASPGWMHQNDTFLPMTINTAVTGIAAAPATSLNGNKMTLSLNGTLTSHPIRNVEVTARYRLFDYDNDTPQLTFLNYVQTDEKVANTARESVGYGFKTENAVVEGVWSFYKKNSVKAGYQYELIDRTHRDVAKSEENIVYTGLTLNPTKWMQFTVNEKTGHRLPSLYQLNTDSYPLGGNGQFALTMRFDEAARNRTQVDSTLQIDAGERLSLYGTYSTVQERYPQSLYGMLNYRTNGGGTGATYALGGNLTLFADAIQEHDGMDMKSRQVSSTNNSSNNDWQSFIRNSVLTGDGGLSFSAFNNKLSIDTFCSVSRVKGNIATYALGSAAVTGFLVTTATVYPETSMHTQSFTADFRYHLRPNVTPRLRYRYERFTNIDFQTSPMMPYMGNYDSASTAQVFLGATLPNYNVNEVSASLEYRF